MGRPGGKHSRHDHSSHIPCGCVHLPIIPHVLNSIQDTVPKPAQKIRALVAKNGLSLRPAESLILHNGTIRTMEDGNATSTVEAIAFHGDIIVETGSLAACESKLPNAKVINLEGKTVLPGLIEPHIHLLSSALARNWFDVSPFIGQNLRENYSLQWCYDAMKEELNNNGTMGGWLLASGLDPSLFQGGDITQWQNPTATDLDENISRDVPLVIMNSSGHIAYANTEALKRAKMEDSNGILLEIPEMSPVFLAALSDQTGSPLEVLQSLVSKMHELFREAAALGVTMMWDGAMGLSGSKLELILLGIVSNTAFCPVRYGGAILFESSDDIEKWVDEEKVHPDSFSSDNFRVSCAKVVSDGSNQGQTGYQSKKYPNPDETINTPGQENGVWNIPEKKFGDLVQKLDKLGWNIMIHANGDTAITRTINAYANAIKANDERDRRHRIEHCSLMDPEQAAAMHDYGISPSFLIGHVGYWGYTFVNKVWDLSIAERIDSTRTAIDNNLRFTLHSDHFVSPLGPLRLLEQAVSRKMEFPDAKGAVLNHKQCVTIAEGLKAITYDAAWQCGFDDICGSLEVGKKADLVILEKDPMTWRADGVGLRNLKVLETWMNGRCTYSASRS